MIFRRRGPRTSVRRAFFSLAAAALACAATAWSATTPLDALYISPDSAITIQNLTVSPGDAVRTLPLALANLGVLPKEANLVGYHRTADGRQLFTLDVSATLAGGVTVTPADVVAYDGNDYTVEFDGLMRGLPRGVEIDAIAVIDGDLLLSFDSAVTFSGFTADDEDLVRVSDGSISLFFDGSAAGVAPGLDLDGAERLSNGHLLLSFDGSGSLGGVSFDDEDVLEHDPDAGTWEVVFDGSLTGTGWEGPDVDAVAAEEVVAATPTILATETPTQTPNPSATSTAQPPTQTPTETRVPTPCGPRSCRQTGRTGRRHRRRRTSPPGAARRRNSDTSASAPRRTHRRTGHWDGCRGCTPSRSWSREASWSVCRGSITPIGAPKAPGDPHWLRRARGLPGARRPVKRLPRYSCGESRERRIRLSRSAEFDDGKAQRWGGLKTPQTSRFGTSRSRATGTGDGLEVIKEIVMGRFANAFGPQNPDATYVGHSFPEQTFDLGEVEMNYAVAGDDSHPALLLIPGQTESWWGYEAAMPLLAERFQAFAVDLRGQGRSTRTPGRYTLDNMGNDLVRFIDGVIGRPVIVSGLSSGGVLAAWLSAYAKPGQIRGALYEDPPLFSSEVSPACGPSLRQAIGAVFALWSKYLGDRWCIGDWDGMLAAAPRELPPWLARLFSAIAGSEPPQNLREYDPEWGRAFWTGTVAASCDHARMLSSVKVPILLTHHFRHVEETTGVLMGALSDLQAARARDLIAACGQPVDYRSFPDMGHAMHAQDPQLFNRTLVDWAGSLA